MPVQIMGSVKKVVFTAGLMVREQLARLRVRGKPKIFVIGRNKTGTTSMKQALLDLGYVLGNQRAAELLYHKHYFRGEFAPFIRYCLSAQAFQDVPFSLPETFKVMDQAFPGSRFILTVRDSSETWYDSVIRFHAKLWGEGGRPPTAAQLRAARYRTPGFAYNLLRLYGTTEENPYHRQTLIAHYERHNSEVLEYFRRRPDDLLVLNLKEPDAYPRFLAFLGRTSTFTSFPWQNQT